ncbi:murein L,D-transpeptidase catalytic domain family protein [Bradyrhizobium sp. CCGUVB1N3]|nr:murein L,D-transpeptidase catalytic domain family protein [Bradyrhizobium sp. CCGUVB1N3]MCP3475464.1 murein L,D-transpeptidase catalytic domain family protein [Bradyrhizobium sp. CCGUVB1N3]
MGKAARSISSLATRRSGRLNGSRGGDPLRARLAVLGRFALGVTIAAWLAAGALAVEQPSETPAWLKNRVGDGEGQIAPVVLQRARALYLRKVAAAVVKNPCYFAMDATRPSDGGLGKRFYEICEADRSFRAMSAGHGSGRNIKGAVNFANGKECAKNFGNALDSNLTTGGAYVTAETKTSFKGYFRNAAKREAVLMRSFVQFDGEGETANARERAIGGHPAIVLKGIHYRSMPRSPYANVNGCVPVGTLVDYASGRSNGCTSWSRSDAEQIIPLLDEPTTVYIYPESQDIKAVAQAVSARRSFSSNGPYWNALCLKQIGAPKFWSNEILEPILARYGRDPERPASPVPTCRP